MEDTLFDYDQDDYILVNNKGEVLAVSGNTDFDYYPEEYIILKVVEKANGGLTAPALWSS